MAREYSMVIYHDEQGISTGHFYGKLEGPGQTEFFGKESKWGPINLAITDPQVSKKRYEISSQNSEKNKLVEIRITLSKEQFEAAKEHVQSITKRPEAYVLGQYDCIQYTQQVYEKAGQVGDFRTLFEKHVALDSLAMRTVFNVAGKQSEVEKTLMSWLPNTVKIYKVKDGDDILTITQNCGITEKELLDKNPGLKASCIYQNGYCIAQLQHGLQLKLPDTANTDHQQISIHSAFLPSTTRPFGTIGGIITRDVVIPGIQATQYKKFAVSGNGEVTPEPHHDSKITSPDVERTIATAIEVAIKIAEEIKIPKDLTKIAPLIKTGSHILGAAGIGIQGILNYAEAKEQHRQYPAVVAIVQTGVGEIAFGLGASLPGSVATGLAVYYIYHQTLHDRVGDQADQIAKKVVKIFKSTPQTEVILKGPQDLDLLFTESGELFPVRHKGNTIIRGQSVKSWADVEGFCAKCTPKLTYTVKKGDTVWGIAKALGMSIKELLDMPGNEKIRDSYRSVGNGKFHAHVEAGQPLFVSPHSKTSSNGEPTFTQCDQHSHTMPPLDIFVEPLHPRVIPTLLSDPQFISKGGALAQGINELRTPSPEKHTPAANTPSMVDIKVGDFTLYDAQDTITR